MSQVAIVSSRALNATKNRLANGGSVNVVDSKAFVASKATSCEGGMSARGPTLAILTSFVKTAQNFWGIALNWGMG